MSREPRTIDVAALIDRSSLGRFNYRVIALSWLVTAFDGIDQLMIGFTAPYLRMSCISAITRSATWSPPELPAW